MAFYHGGSPFRSAGQFGVEWGRTREQVPWVRHLDPLVNLESRLRKVENRCRAGSRIVKQDPVRSPRTTLRGKGEDHYTHVRSDDGVGRAVGHLSEKAGSNVFRNLRDPVLEGYFSTVRRKIPVGTGNLDKGCNFSLFVRLLHLLSAAKFESVIEPYLSVLFGFSDGGCNY